MPRSPPIGSSRGALLRLNAPVSFGARQIAPLLAEFAQRHPRVTVELGLNDRLVDLVDEGWDLAIRIGNLSNSSLIARRIAPCRIVVCAAPSYLEGARHPAHGRDLADHNCLGYTLSRLTPVDRWVFGAEARSTFRISGNLRANNGDALRAAAIAGQGIIHQPTFIVADDIREADGRARSTSRPSSSRHLCRLPAGPASRCESARVHRLHRGTLCAGAALGSVSLLRREKSAVARSGLALSCHLLAAGGCCHRRNTMESVMSKPGLDNRHRDKDGEISHKHGNTLVRTLRKILRKRFCSRLP